MCKSCLSLKRFMEDLTSLALPSFSAVFHLSYFHSLMVLSRHHAFCLQGCYISTWIRMSRPNGKSIYIHIYPVCLHNSFLLQTSVRMRKAHVKIFGFSWFFYLCATNKMVWLVCVGLYSNNKPIIWIQLEVLAETLFLHQSKVIR
jgi:hypothetical protein